MNRNLSTKKELAFAEVLKAKLNEFRLNKRAGRNQDASTNNIEAATET